MKKIVCLLSLILTLSYGRSQINEKDTLVTTISAKKASVNLQADVLPDYINLQWTKGPDDFTGYFELYRSADGIAYNIVRQFHPATFEGNQRYFTYKDEDPLRGKNYYRLVSVDKFTQERKMVELVAEYKNQPRKIIPTIVSKGNQLNISNYDGQQLELLVFNSAGKPMFKRVISSSVVPVAGNLTSGCNENH
jgi:hypothetical protein